MIRAKTLILLLPIGLMACAPAPQPEPETPQVQEQDPLLTSCLTAEQQALVGSPELQARAVLPQTARVIPADSLFSQDYLPNRVNADLDANGIVNRVWCG